MSNMKPEMENKIAEAPVKQKKERSALGVRIAKYATALVVVLVLFWFGFTTVVKEGSCAVILRFGAVREEVTEAGLYFKLPWPFESVVTYDNRVQYLEANRLETTTKDKRNIVIQSYVAWQIADPVLFHNSVGAGGTVNSYLNDQVFSATNSTLGTYNLTALVSLNKEEVKIDTIQEEIFERVRENCLANYGITVVDISILRLSLPDMNLESVFEQMRNDRESEINAILARANAEADKIIADADAEAESIRADGTDKAAEIKRETERQVAAIHAAAASADVSLYDFLSDLDTYVQMMNNKTTLIVEANEYPFNILYEYAEIANEDTVIYDLSYILSRLPASDRNALVDAIVTLIQQSAADNGIPMN